MRQPSIKGETLRPATRRWAGEETGRRNREKSGKLKGVAPLLKRKCRLCTRHDHVQGMLRFPVVPDRTGDDEVTAETAVKREGNGSSTLSWATGEI